jgi:nucleoside-diphosphate-sugar epimerase
MRVFVTGASGWIGSAVVPELIGAGHHVVGLARSDDAAQRLTAAGAEVQPGTIDDVDVLRQAAGDADGVLHLAFKHEIAFSGDFEGAAAADRAAIEAFGGALAGTDRPFVIASGTLGLAPDRVVTEQDGQVAVPSLPPGPAARYANALLTLALADRGIRSCVVRLPPTVHGDGDNGFMATLVGIAREKGVAGYVGGGANRWPAVHRSAAAVAFRLALETAPAGSVLHAVSEEGVAIRDVAEVMGRGLDLPTASIAPEDAPAHFGWLAGFVGTDGPASSTATRELLGWEPAGPGLLEDLAAHYLR